MGLRRGPGQDQYRNSMEEIFGAAQYYTGTDTVRGGKIVAADVTRTG